jgi:ribosomal protein S18 acetylase RimI-like enzyme
MSEALPVRIRPFEPTRDMEKFAALNLQTFWESIPEPKAMKYAEFQRQHLWLLEHYAPHNPERSQVTVAATGADDYVGHCWLGVQVDFFTHIPVAWIFDITVRPEYRGQGIGKLLLDDCAQRCRLRGFSSMGLQVMASNEVALAFYAREGFEPQSHSLYRKI